MYQIGFYLLILLILPIHGLIWTRYSIADCCKLPSPTGSVLHCSANSSLADIYGLCSSVGSIQVCCMSENPTLFPTQPTLPDYPDYLVPIYDGSCVNTQVPSFLGHVAILVNSNQVTLLFYLTPHGGYYECHLNEWLYIQNPNATNPMTIKNVMLDANLTSLSTMGSSTNTATNNMLIFQNTNNTIITSWPENPILLGSWPVTSWIGTKPYWSLSLSLTLKVWSTKTLQYRTVLIPVVAGTTMIDCNNPLITDPSTCAIINRQLRLFNKPYTILPPNIASYSITSKNISTVSLEQCQQLHAYYLDSTTIYTDEQESSSSRTLMNQSYYCPNPLLTTLDFTAPLFNLQEATPIVAKTSSPTVMKVPSPTVVMKVPSSPTEVLSPTEVPSPTVVTEPLSTVTETPSSPNSIINPPSNSSTMTIIIVVSCIGIMLLIMGGTCFYMRRRNAQAYNQGRLSHRQIQLYYALCCLPHEVTQGENASRIGTLYGHETESKPEEEEEMTPLDTNRQPLMADSAFKAASDLHDSMQDEFQAPSFQTRPPTKPIPLDTSENNPFDDLDDIFDTGNKKEK